MHWTDSVFTWTLSCFSIHLFMDNFKKYITKLPYYVIIITWTLLIYNLKLKLFILITRLDYFAELFTDFSYTNFTVGLSYADALDRLRVHLNIILLSLILLLIFLSSEDISEHTGGSRGRAIRPSPLPVIYAVANTVTFLWSNNWNVIKIFKSTKYLSGNSAHDCQNAFSFNEGAPEQELCPWTPLGAPHPNWRYRLVLNALAMPLPFQLLDPPVSKHPLFVCFGVNCEALIDRLIYTV